MWQTFAGGLVVGVACKLEVGEFVIECLFNVVDCIIIVNEIGSLVISSCPAVVMIEMRQRLQVAAKLFLRMSRVLEVGGMAPHCVRALL